MVTTRKKTGIWSEAALRVLRERYLWKKGGQPVEDPDGMCWRVARAIAEAEKHFQPLASGDGAAEEWAERFHEVMVDLKFMPNSPTLMNAGKENGLQLSACYVLPIEDTMEGIFDSIKHAAIIHKSGGGTGFAFSRLRPEGSEVAATHGVASGPVSFLKVFDAATEAVKQGGTRRGANMGILRVDHPDILQFIECKLTGGITNFNISVAITDRFMEALAQDGEYDLVAPHTKEVTGRLRSREVFQRIVAAAWATGDPGLVFIDRMNRSPANPTPELGQIEATNPCGEQPLLPFEACNLGSINLCKFLNEGGAIDWEELERVARLAVRFLDDVIEMNPYPLPEVDHWVKANRRVGLGVMGWADLLCLMGIPYDSEQALELGEQVMGFINRIGHDESARLAQERGAFPNFGRSIYRGGPPLRNATVTTIAPTGTISIIAGCSSGIEPHFALAFRHIVGERHLAFVNPHFQEVAQARGFFSDELMELLARLGTVGDMPEVPEDVRRVFVTAHEVPPEWHVRMQAAFQKHTDNGVSKTINLPHSATVEDVGQAYLLAWESSCLGITVFRSGSKGEQVLHVGTGPQATLGQDEELSEEMTPLRHGPAWRPTYGSHPTEPAELALRSARADELRTIRPRPKVVKGATYRMDTPLGTAFITVNRNSGDEPFEVFLNVGKAGSDTAAVAEALGRLVSLSLRLPSTLSPVDRMKEIIAQLAGIGGARPTGFGKERVRSLPDAVAQVLAEDLGLEEWPVSSQGERAQQLPLPGVGDLCPECGHATLIYEEGCQKCYSCGFSEC